MSGSKRNKFNWAVIGHLNIINYLQNSIDNSNISQAYLFVGPSNIGKTLVAEYFVDSLFCDNLKTDQAVVPCGQCSSCQQIKNKIHPDIFYLKRVDDEKTGKLKKNIGIGQVRELQNKLSLHSFLDSYKIGIIFEAEKLSQEAANSLLKSLEEPTKKTIFILLTNNADILPKTILSRCQILNFLPVRTKDINDYLLNQNVDRKDSKIISGISLGRPGIAINYSEDNESYLEFQDQIKQFIFLIKKNSLLDNFRLIDDLTKNNDINTLKNLLDIWIMVLRDLILVKCVGQNLASNHKILSELNQLADLYSRQKLFELLEKIFQVKKYLEANVNSRLTLENFVLNF